MANKWGLKFPDKVDRDQLRPSVISTKIAERGWISEIKMKLLVQENYACTPEQADALLIIAVQNGFVKSEHKKRGGWRYRVIKLANTEETLHEAGSYREAITVELTTTYEPTASYGDDLF